ncbi:MAG: General stress protein 16O [Chlamydiae bacterium]|nr:General stress protein 16O [Chlamydiota bacterium]
MPLSEKQIESFQGRLLEMKAQLLHTLEGTTQNVKRPDEATGYTQHQADQGTDDFDRTISLEVTSKEYALLRQVERALEKVDEGSYGRCDVSEEEIPYTRLDAIPYATMTVKSQELFEKGLLT